VKQNDWWEYYDDPVNKLHADFPGLDCIPQPGGREAWYANTDGGIFRSDDGMATFTNISLAGLGVSQYYDTHTSINDPDLLLAGSQDQGYQRSTGPGRGAVWDFEQLISGDYGHLSSSDGTHGTVFSVYPGFVLVQQGEQNPVLSGYLDFPANEDHGWMPFIVADPAHAQGFYFCGTRLHKASWLGGDQVLYRPSDQLFTVYGGDTNDASLIAVLPEGDGWEFAMRLDDTIDPSGGSIRDLDGQSRFGFVYVPYDAANFNGGLIDGASGDLVAGSGISVTRVAEGEYEIEIPGKDKTTGSVSLQIAGETPGQPGVPDVAFANYDFDFDRGVFVVNTRVLDFGDDVFGESSPLRDASFYFLYSDFETPISLEAACRADIDGDGSLTLFDFLAFQNLFDSGDLAADFDGDGSLTLFDFLAFQNEFDAGCP